MRPSHLLLGLLLGVGLTLLPGCGGGDATVTPNIVNGGVTGARPLDRVQDALIRWISPQLAPLTRGTGVAAVGQTTAASLTSLQYFIQTIQLCTDVTLNGTGYSGTSGCVTLYTSPDTSVQDTSFYNTYTVTEGLADTSADHFVDFMTAEGRAKLATAASISSGTYHYVLLNFMRPIKMTAEFKDSAGTTRFFTKTPTAGEIVAGTADSGGREIEYVNPTDATAGPAALMTYMLNNGGVVVPLAKPFTVATGESVLLDFVFNPDNFATASAVATCGTPSNSPAVYDLNHCVNFDLPYAKMAPVPRKAGETTRKEVYLVDYTTGASVSKVRVELYYNSADTDKSIRGIDASVVMGTGATESTTNIISSYKSVETAGVVTLLGYNSATGQIDGESLTGLTRRTAGTASIKCLFAGGPCTTVGGTAVSAAYTYVGDFSVGT